MFFVKPKLNQNNGSIVLKHKVNQTQILLFLATKIWERKKNHIWADEVSISCMSAAVVGWLKFGLFSSVKY